MTRFKNLLLTGTVLPALVLTPFAGVSAQTPGNERHGPGAPGAPGAGHGAGAAGAAHGGGAAGAPHVGGEASPHAGGPGGGPAHAAAPAVREAPHAAGGREASPRGTAPTQHDGARAGGPAAHEGARTGAPASREDVRGGAGTAAHEGARGGAPHAHEGNRAAEGARATEPGGREERRGGAAPGGAAGTRGGTAGQPGTPAAREGARPGGSREGIRAGEATPGGAAGTRGGTAGQPGTPAAREGARPGGPREGTRAGEAAPNPTRPGAAPAAPGGTAGGPVGGRPVTPSGAPAAREGAAPPPAAGGRFGEGRPGPAAGAPNGTPTGAPGRAGTQPGRQFGGPGPNGAGGQNRGGIGPGGAAAIGAAAGFAGGFLAATTAHHLDEIRGAREERVEDGRTFIREPGRTIVEENGRAFIVHDEDERFRELGYEVRRERSGRDTIDVIDRPGGIKILTFTDPEGRMLRRVRRFPDGHEVVLIDNGFEGRVRPPEEDIVELPPPSIDIPRNRYIVDYADADENVIYDTLEAPPLQPPPRRYTLDQIRYSPDVRSYVRAVDINTINFDTGSWTVPSAATGKLRSLGTAIKRSVDRNPNTVFLVEGYTDATGNPTDNLSLSDRRAQSVAAILSRDFGVPPENLTTQGYGQQNLKVNTQGASAANRRVVVQNITPLLAAGGAPPR